MSAEPRTRDAPRGLLALYDLVLPAVYGYFARRCHDRGTAEDLTSETFLAAMDSARKEDPPDISVPWLIGVARPKLADHHRHRRHSDVSVADMREPDASDDWDAELDRIVAESALARLSGPHRAVLTLGMPLAVYRPEADQPRPQLNGFGPGELSYVTYEVGDSSAFRDFYGRVLGWVFEPGRIDDGWQITDAHPMAGVAGGSAEPTTVPMWTVADVEDAVARVREAGGTVIQEPTRQQYGVMAECRDDQGTRFYLGEF